MYIVEIWDPDTRTSVGPVWFTNDNLDLPEARAKAAKWVADTEDSDRYKIISKIVGCL